MKLLPIDFHNKLMVGSALRRKAVDARPAIKLAARGATKNLFTEMVELRAH